MTIPEYKPYNSGAGYCHVTSELRMNIFLLNNIGIEC